MYPTRHAIQRFQERVSPVSTAEAARLIAETARTARVRPTPRWWTPVAPAPGLLFVYPSALPGVCFLVRDGAVITVFERSKCRSWQHNVPADPGRTRGVAYQRSAANHEWAAAA